MSKKNNPYSEPLHNAAKTLKTVKDSVDSMSELYKQVHQNITPAVEGQETTSKVCGRKMQEIFADIAKRTEFINTIAAQIQEFTSAIYSRLQSIDYAPLVGILKDICHVRDDVDYKSLNDIFLKAMASSKWFPYAGWIADIKMAEQFFDILDRSKKERSRTKKIDKLIFSYYDKKNLDELKRRWRRQGLYLWLERILIQGVQAYCRREYALTVSALVPLWECIIQEKANGNGYRTVGKTQEKLKKLIKKNGYDEIFTSFSTEFIYYTCDKIEDVKPDVPGRHGIVHGWYTNYPTRKEALNAILFTDFLLNIKPLEKEEENNNGQNEI